MVDAEGLVVAPGFIDTDTYMDHAATQVLDGVTTALALLVGTSDVDDWYRRHQGRMPIHFGGSIDYSQVREELRREGVIQRIQEAHATGHTSWRHCRIGTGRTTERLRISSPSSAPLPPRELRSRSRTSGARADRV